MHALREGSFFILSKKRRWKWNVWLRKPLNLSNSVSNISRDSSGLQEAKTESQLWASTALGTFEMRSHILHFESLWISVLFLLLLFWGFPDAMFAQRGWIYNPIHLSASGKSREILLSLLWTVKTLWATLSELWLLPGILIASGLPSSSLWTLLR